MAGGGDPDGQEARRRTQAPAGAWRPQGPTVVLLEGGGASPIRSPCPGSLLPEAAILTARRRQGPTAVLLEGGGASPIRSPCPGSPLPVEAAILTMIERSTLILAPARAGRAASKKHIWYYDVLTQEKGSDMPTNGEDRKIISCPLPRKASALCALFLGRFLIFLFISFYNV